MILLYHEAATEGMIATPSHPVAGDHLPPRTYMHKGHFIEIDGPTHVVAHDAEEICKIPGYRLATPEEQSDYMASKRKGQSISESGASSKKETK